MPVKPSVVSSVFPSVFPAIGGRGTQVPYARTIIFVGDSITDASQVNTSATVKNNARASFANWALAKLNGRAFANYNPTGTSYSYVAAGTYEFGSFGATVTTIQNNHLAEINSNPADLVCLLVGANNLGNINQTSAQTFTEIQTFVNALKAAGHSNLLVCALTPRTAANNSLGSDGKTFALRVQETNALLAAWCPTVGAKFCDWTSVIADGSGFWNSGLSSDNVHPNTKGSQVMGEFLATFLAANYRLNDSILTTAFISTLNTNSSPVSGFSFFTFGGTASQATVTGDTLGDWRRVTTTHADAVASYTEFSRSNTVMPVGWGMVNGDLIQPVVEMRCLSDIATYGLEVKVTGNGYTSRVAFPGSAAATPAFEGLFFGQPFPVLAATTPTVFVTIKGTGVIDFRRLGYRKVTSMVPPYI